MKKVVIGIGELLWDILPTGKKAGGAPVNFAYHASQNGVEGWAISAIGEDELGKELKKEVEAHNIKSLVEVVGHPTGTVNVELNNGSPNFIITKDAAWDYIPITAKSIELAKSASAICFGTLAQRNATSRATTETLVKLTPESAYRVYDINLRQTFYSKELIESSLSMANVFKINNEEMVILKNLLNLTLSDSDMCKWLIEQFELKMVILTAGDKYSSIYTKGQVSTIITPEVVVVDTVGAGDSFSGALIGSLLRGHSLQDAHKSAVETSAYVCTCAGAWTPPKK